jgi:hypothetical protein
MTMATPLSDRAHHLIAATGPFASVYFDDSHDAPDAASRLEVTWQDIARELAGQGADASLVAVLERAVLGAAPSVGHSGHGLIATADGVLVDEHLVACPATPEIRLSGLPYVLPLLEYGSAPRSYVVVAIDQVGAEITLHQPNTVHTETVDGDGFPVHEANAGIHGWGDQQHRVEEAVRKNVRAVAHALIEQCDRYDPEVVFVIGQDRTRAELASVLPDRVGCLVVRPRVGARHTGVDDLVRQAITLEFQSRQAIAARRVAQDFHAEAGRQSGLAVEGLTAVCAALRESAVATLLVGNLAEQTVLGGGKPTLVATDADALSDYGVPPTQVLRADEALPFAAITSGADVLYAGVDLDVQDGVAALLRFGAPVLTRARS